MRLVCVVALFCVLGCSRTRSFQSSVHAEKQNSTPLTLKSLVYVDASSADAQHPLVCGGGGDFPAGREFAFRQSGSRESVHAVFPEGVTPPKALDGKFVLHGHFQGIQNRDRYKVKKPKEDYRYFVVSSWEHMK